MAPKTHNFLLYQGDTHLFKVLLTADSEPVDLSQAAFQMDIVAGDGSVIRPEITVAGNAVMLLFPAAVTRDLTWLRAKYDLRAVFGNVVKTYLQGEVQVKPCVTDISVELSGDEPVVETVDVDVNGQAIIVLSGQAIAPDSAVIAGLLAKIEQLESDVQLADESAEIAALSEQLAVAQAAIESAGSLEGRLKLLERDQVSISEHAVELAKQKAALEEALTQLVAADSAVKSLTSQLEILRIQFASAEESSEIEALDQRIADISVELEKAKQAAAEAEESSELAELQQKIAELAVLSESQSQITAEIVDLRNLLGLRKCEKIHLTQAMWADGGYTWAKVNFRNTYKDPRVHVSVEHPALAVLFLNHNICAKTENSVMIRSNFDKTKIDTSYSIYLYVEEWQDSIG